MAFKKFIKAKLIEAFSGVTVTGGDTNEQGVDLSRIDVVHIIKGVAVSILTAILGASGVVFSSYPFGIAYLCAANRYVVYAYIGLIISALFNSGYAVAFTVVYTVVLMLRYSLGRLAVVEKPTEKTNKQSGILSRLRTMLNTATDEWTAFDENVVIRCTVACFCALVFGLYRLISGGFLYYDLFGLLSGFLMTPIVTLALTGMFTKNELFARAGEISWAALMFITVFALRDYSVFGYSPSFIAAFFITLWASNCVGALKGCVVGLLAGFACGGLNLHSTGLYYELAYSIGAAPCILAAGGLTAGFLRGFSRTVSAVAAGAAVMMLGLVVDGYAVLTRLLPDVMCAAVLYIPLAKFNVLPRLPILSAPVSERIEEDVFLLEKQREDATVRINALSEAFSHLSDTIYSLSDRMRKPGVVDLKQVCDSAFEGFCEKCSLASFCLERECLSTLDAQSKMTAELYRNGKITLDDVPEYFKNRCFNITAVIDEINTSTARLIEKLLRNDKTEVFAMDYEAMSKLLAVQINAGEAEYKIDTERTRKLRRSLKYMGFPAERAICFGSRKKQVVIGDLDPLRVKLGMDDIRKMIENTVESLMDQPRFSIDGDVMTMTLSVRRRFAYEVARASSIKESESANGDSVTAFENREDYFYALISDGMGSGREAAITSKICSMFIERMLSAGNSPSVTLEMLNGFLRSRGNRSGECSATVDLVQIDLITGKAYFIKSGAAPSFVLRSGNLYKLQSKTVPIGIMPEVDAEKIGFDLIGGDVLVMLSDGVAQSLEDGVWLANLLTYEWEDDLNAMADKILDNAALTNKRSDDMTVTLVRVHDNEKAK